MRVLPRIISYFTVLIISTSVTANPIPYPIPASMPLEDMYADLRKTDEGLEARFNGNYYFTLIPDDVTEMKYPLPPESREISVEMGFLPEYWEFSETAIPYIHELTIALEPIYWIPIDETYPTVVPFWPDIPMIAWGGPFPYKALVTTTYTHELPEVKNGYLFFYPLGTGKYDATYQKEAFAFLDIAMPANYRLEKLYMDETPYPYAETWEDAEGDETRKIISIYANEVYGGFTEDIIAFITKWDHLFNHHLHDDDFAEHDNDREAVRDKNNWPNQLKLQYDVEQCGTTEPPLLETNIKVIGKKIRIADSIYFNCCAEYIRMTMKTDGDKIIFREKAMEEAPCDCICYYPMQGVAGPFQSGSYQVELLDPHGRLILETSIEVK